MNEHALVSRAAAAGSCVLLKNVANTLPFTGTLDAPVRVAVFGIGQIFTPTGLSGMDPWRRVGILDGLSAERTVAQDTLLAHKYRAWALEHPEGSEMPLGNLSMAQVAERATCSPLTIGRIEKGAPTVAIGIYLRVLYALQLDDDILLLAKEDAMGKALQDLSLKKRERASKKE